MAAGNAATLPTMLYLYLVCAGFAGTFIAFTLATGGEGGAGDDLGHDGDGGDSAHASHAAVSPDASFSWLPITSLRFWTFALAFFGLTGAILTWLGNTGTVVTLLLAVVVAWVVGVMASWVSYVLGVRESTSQVSDTDLEGASATVIVAFGKGATGKVRIESKGRVFDVLALTDDDVALAEGAQVLVISVANGTAMVSPMSVG